MSSYYCDVCHSYFHTQRGLSVHLRVHLGQLPPVGDGNHNITTGNFGSPVTRSRHARRRAESLPISIPQILNHEDAISPQAMEDEASLPHSPSQSPFVVEDMEGFGPHNGSQMPEQSIGASIPISNIVNDTFLRCFTSDELAMAKLYHLCDNVGSPRYLLDEIMKVVRNEMSTTGFNPLSTTLPSRQSLLNKAQDVTAIPAPTPVTVDLESGKSVVVWRNAFPQLLQDHLLSQSFGDTSLLDIPDPDQPFSSKPQGGLPRHSSLFHSYWYHKTYAKEALKMDTGQYILHPLILYIDKTGVDGIMKNTVEPLVCTSAVLNQSQRQNTKNWMVLGFIPSFDAISKRTKPAAQWVAPGSSTGRSSNLRDYHRCIAALLSPLKAMQKEHPIMLFRRNDIVMPMRIICPVISVLGDNLSQNALCGKVDNKFSSSFRMSRCCLTPFSQCDSIPHHCNRFPTELEHELSMAALGPTYGHQNSYYRSPNFHQWLHFLNQPHDTFSREQLILLRTLRQEISDEILKKCLGSHCLLNAFTGIDFGSSSCIHTSTVADIMHSFESGLVTAVTQILFQSFTPTMSASIDSLVESLFGSLHRSSLSQQFPRISFLRGFCSLTLLSSSERVGQLFVVALLLNTKEGSNVLRDRFALDFDSRREQRSNANKRPRVSNAEGSSQTTSPDTMEIEAQPVSTVIRSRRMQCMDEDVPVLLRRLDLDFVNRKIHQLPPTHQSQLNKVVKEVVYQKVPVNSKITPTDLLGGEGEVFPRGLLDYQQPQVTGTSTEGWPEHISVFNSTPPGSVEEEVDIHPEREGLSISLDQEQFRDLLELMLCFHSFLKYGGSLLVEDTHAALYHASFTRMMGMIRKGMQRASNTLQWKTQKFLECSHFLQDHLMRGPPVAHSTDTGERGLKTWAKAPAATAQNRGDTIFKQQVAKNYHQTQLFGKVILSHNPPSFNHRTPPPQGPSVHGRAYVYMFLPDGSHGFYHTHNAQKENPSPCLNGMFPKVVTSKLHSIFGRWYTRQCRSESHFRLKIPIFTELMIPATEVLDNEDIARIRAHPNYRAEGAWYDYVTVSYEYEGEHQGDCPARVAAIFQIPEEFPLTELQHVNSLPESHRDVMVLLHESKYQTPQQLGHDSRICSRWTLDSKINGEACIDCISHTCISSVVFAIDLVPDPPRSAESSRRDPFLRNSGEKFQILVVGNRKIDWPSQFLHTRT
jgi:hypothetical protein